MIPSLTFQSRVKHSTNNTWMSGTLLEPTLMSLKRSTIESLLKRLLRMLRPSDLMNREKLMLLLKPLEFRLKKSKEPSITEREPWKRSIKQLIKL